MCRFANIRKSPDRAVRHKNQETGTKIDMTLTGYGKNALSLAS